MKNVQVNISKIIYFNIFDINTVNILGETLLFNYKNECENIENNSCYDQHTINEVTRPENDVVIIMNLIDKAKNEFKEITRNNQKYKDNTFISNNTSLYNYPDHEFNNKIQINWLGPNDINSLEINKSQFRTIFNDPNINDSLQGDVGDCWLISAINLLANHKNFLNDIFLRANIRQMECIKNECFKIKLCVRGKWQIVTVDNKLPCYPNNTLKYSNTLNNQLYCSLIEKAVAKVSKNYENLISGTSEEGILF